MVDSVKRHMVGKSFNFILTFLRQAHANTELAATNITARFITLLKRRGKPTTKVSKSFQKLEQLAFKPLLMSEICWLRGRKVLKVIIIDF